MVGTEEAASPAHCVELALFCGEASGRPQQGLRAGLCPCQGASGPPGGMV